MRKNQIKASRYVKITVKWLGISLLIGLMLAFAGAGRGDASVIFVIFTLAIGVTGTIIHTTVLVFKNDNKKHQAMMGFLNACLLLGIARSVIDDQKCRPVTQQEARNIVIKRLEKDRKETKYLGKATPDPAQCAYSFLYATPTKKIEYFVSDGKLYSMPH